MAMTLGELADQVRAALTARDLDAFRELLTPDARWGPGDEPNFGMPQPR